MKGIYEKTLLFDYYGELLTAHQREIYENVVMNDMSLSEAASEYGISRQGVHDLIKRCNEALEGFEKKLHMVEQTEKIRRAAEEISMTVAKRMQDRPGEKALPAMKKAAEKSPGAEKKNTSENEAELAKVRALAENILKAIQ